MAKLKHAQTPDAEVMRPVENANPFTDGGSPAEPVAAPKRARLKDKLSVQSRSRTFMTKLLGFGSGAVAFSILALFVKFIGNKSKSYRIRGSYDPLHVIEYLLRPENLPMLFCILLLSVGIGTYAVRAYLNHIKFVENGRVLRAKSGSYGQSDWLNNEERELRETFDISEDLSHPGYIPLGVYNDRVYSVPQFPKHTQFKNQNLLVCGGAGSGKSFGVIGPMIEGRIEYEESFVVTDTKGDLYRTYAKLCEKKGYNVFVFNTDNFKASDSWNCLEDAANAAESDIYEYVDRIANTFIRNTSEGEKADYWQKNEHDLLRCCLHLICRDSSYEGRRTFSELIDLINGEEQEITDKLEASDEKVQHAARSYLSATDAKLRENYRSGLANRLQIYRTPMVAEALSVDGIDIERAVHEKTAIFVITKDSETTYDAVTSLFITSLYIKLVEISNSRNYRNSLMTPFWLIIDELCNMAELEDLSRKISTSRSRKINFCLAIQSISQLDVKYPHLASNILANCGVFTFLGNDDPTTAKYVSERAGTFTQLMRMEQTGERNKLTRKFVPVLFVREREQEAAKNLIEVHEASQFPSGRVVQFIIGKHPFRANTYTEDKHFLYEEIEEAEPSERTPDWYVRFCESHPELLEMPGKEYIPSERELRMKAARDAAKSSSAPKKHVLTTEERENIARNEQAEKENDERFVRMFRGGAELQPEEVPAGHPDAAGEDIADLQAELKAELSAEASEYTEDDEIF